jgi:hypothetical protein
MPATGFSAEGPHKGQIYLPGGKPVACFKSHGSWFAKGYTNLGGYSSGKALYRAVLSRHQRSNSRGGSGGGQVQGRSFWADLFGLGSPSQPVGRQGAARVRPWWQSDKPVMKQAEGGGWFADMFRDKPKPKTPTRPAHRQAEGGGWFLTKRPEPPKKEAWYDRWSL